MSTLEINRMLLANLYEQFPESLKGLALKDNYLIYGLKKIDISNFNIYDLLSEETVFASTLNYFKAEDIFNIISLHVQALNSDNKKEDEDDSLKIISLDEYKEIINSPQSLTENERKKIDIFYNYLGLLAKYEECSHPKLRNVLKGFRSLIYELEYGNNQRLNDKQKDAISKAQMIEIKRNETGIASGGDKDKEDVQKLELKASSSGSISALQVIIAVIIVTILLTLITFYIVQ